MWSLRNKLLMAFGGLIVLFTLYFVAGQRETERIYRLVGEGSRPSLEALQILARLRLALVRLSFAEEERSAASIALDRAARDAEWSALVEAVRLERVAYERLVAAPGSAYGQFATHLETYLSRAQPAERAGVSIDADDPLSDLRRRLDEVSVVINAMTPVEEEHRAESARRLMEVERLLARSTRWHAMGIATIVLGLIMAIAFTHGILGTVRRSTQAAREITSGRFTTIPVEGADELAEFATAFNHMVQELNRVSQANRDHVASLERQTEALRAVSEELRSANESLQISQEEIQSQKEELESANEELTILNEDLEQKAEEHVRLSKALAAEKDELRTVMAQLDSIFSGIQDTVVLVDEAGYVIRANRWPADFRPDRPPSDLRYDRVFIGESPKPDPVSATLQMRAPCTVTVQGAERRSLEICAYPVVSSHDAAHRVVLFIRDVTRQQELDDRLVRADKLSTLGELMAGVAHELNNPLSTVIGYAELCTEKALASPADLAAIREAAMQCRSIVQDLLVYARTPPVERQAVEPVAVINKVLELVHNTLRLHDIEVRTDMDPLPVLWIDPHHLTQVMLNVVNNATQALAESPRSRRLGIVTRHDCETVRITVSDNGSGIAPEIRPKIFEPFFTTKADSRGTGLGLSVSLRLIKQYGGDILVESGPSGSTFTVVLPVVPPPVPPALPQTSPSLFEGRRALLVEDEPSIQSLVAEALARVGMVVEGVSNGEEAVRRLSQPHRYDCIVSDIQMPKMGGRDLYEWGRTHRPDLSGHWVFITGDTVSSETQRFLREIQAGSIQKPFSLAQLRSAVAAALAPGDRPATSTSPSAGAT